MTFTTLTPVAARPEIPSLAGLLRQIGHDERTHKQASLINMRTPRFAA
jgi:hypothetical protein